MANDLHEVDEPHDHDRGLAFDVSTLIQRRRALKLIAGAGLVALVGCGSDDDAASTASTSSTTAGASGSGSGSTSGSETTAGSDGGVSAIPDETAGPYPGDGSNGPNVLTESCIVRSDIRPSFRLGVGRRRGCAVDGQSDGPRPCGWFDAAGGRRRLRVALHQGRRVLPVLAEHRRRELPARRPGGRRRRSAQLHEHLPGLLLGPLAAHPLRGLRHPRRRHGRRQPPIATSQLALPEEACATVYATDGYSQSVQNLARTSLETDGVFSDGYAQELATTTGSVASGYVAELSVGV